MSSTYPGGFASGVTIRGVPLTTTNPGEIFWVNNSSVLAKNGAGGSNGNDGTYRRPFSTIDFAIGKCTASRGDIIVVMPGYTETLTTAGAIAVDVAGVAIVGLGIGTMRPTITMNAAAATVLISAANVSIQNFLFPGAFADVAAAVATSAAWTSLDRLEFTESGSGNYLAYMAATGASDGDNDGLSVTNCRGTAVDGNQNSMITLLTDVDRLVVADCFYSSEHASTQELITVASGKTLTNILLSRLIYSAPSKTGGAQIIGGSTAVDNTGIMENCLGATIDTDSTIIEDATGIMLFENYVVTTIATQGTLDPVGSTIA